MLLDFVGIREPFCGATDTPVLGWTSGTVWVIAKSNLTASAEI